MKKQECENYSVLSQIQFSFRVHNDEFDFENDLYFVTDFSKLNRKNDTSFDIKVNFHEIIVHD